MKSYISYFSKKKWPNPPMNIWCKLIIIRWGSPLNNTIILSKDERVNTSLIDLMILKLSLHSLYIGFFIGQECVLVLFENGD